MELKKRRLREAAKLYNKVLCPVCGKYGFKSKRWAANVYYPKYGTYYELYRDEVRTQYVRGTRYRGKSLYLSRHLVEEDKDKKSHKSVSYPKSVHRYIGHYDADKQQEQMIKFYQGKIKSRPNGRKWCYVRSNVKFYSNVPGDKPGTYHDSLLKYCSIGYCPRITALH